MPFGETEADQTVALPYGQHDPAAHHDAPARSVAGAVIRTVLAVEVVLLLAWLYVKGQAR